MSKLSKALQQKFRTPADAIRALGLDPSVLESDESQARDSKDGVSDKEINMKKAKLSRQGAICIGVMASYLRPKLAQDMSVNLLPIFDGVTAKNYSQKRPQILRDIKRACSGKLARDTSLGEVAEFLDMLQAHPDQVQGEEEQEVPDELPGELEKPMQNIGSKFAEPDVMDADPLTSVEAFLKDKLEPADLHQVLQMLKGDTEGGEEEPAPMPEEGMEEEPEEGIEKPPMKKPAKPPMKKPAPMEGGEDEEEGGEEKLKELGAADEDEEEADHNNDKDWRPAKGGQATDEEEDEEMTAKDEPSEFRGSPKVGGKMAGDKNVVTRAEMKSSLEAAVAAARKTERDIREAERSVLPWVGALPMTFDSAEQVYRKALKMMGVPGVDKVHASALKTILEMQPKPGARRPTTARTQAQDSAASATSFNERYPDAGRIRLT